MVKHPLLAHSTEVLKCLKFPPLNLVPWACTVCAEEFLAVVTEGVVHSVYKVVTRPSFSVTW